MSKKLNLKILLSEGFMPLEESKEGMLRGGFVMVANEVANNCHCTKIPNDCECNGNACNKPITTNHNCPCSNTGNNCSCTIYYGSSSSSTSNQALGLPFI